MSRRIRGIREFGEMRNGEIAYASFGSGCSPMLVVSQHLWLIHDQAKFNVEFKAIDPYMYLLGYHTQEDHDH